MRHATRVTGHTHRTTLATRHATTQDPQACTHPHHCVTATAPLLYDDQGRELRRDRDQHQNQRIRRQALCSCIIIELGRSALRDISRRQSMVRRAAWSPLAALFAGAAGTEVMTQANLTTFTIDVENTRYVHAVAFSADSKAVVAGGRGDRYIRLYPISPSGVGEQYLLDDTCKATVNAIDFSGDGKWMAASCEDQRVRESVMVYSAVNVSSTHTVNLVRTFDEYIPFLALAPTRWSSPSVQDPCPPQASMDTPTCTKPMERIGTLEP